MGSSLGSRFSAFSSVYSCRVEYIALSLLRRSDLEDLGSRSVVVRPCLKIERLFGQQMQIKGAGSVVELNSSAIPVDMVGQGKS